MPIRDFVCSNQKCQLFELKQEHYQATVDSRVNCTKCGCSCKQAPRSNEGPGHTTHVRIK